MLHSKLALVVAEVFSPKEEGELRVVLLLLHCHLFKLGPVPGDKLGQLVDDIPQFLICTRKKEEESNIQSELRQLVICLKAVQTNDKKIGRN